MTFLYSLFDDNVRMNKYRKNQKRKISFMIKMKMITVLKNILLSDFEAH